MGGDVQVRNRDGSLLATGAYDGLARVFSKEGGWKLGFVWVETFRGWNHDGSLLATGAYAGLARVFSKEGGRTLGKCLCGKGVALVLSRRGEHQDGLLRAMGV